MTSSYDPVYGWQPAIPEPFWVRSWRTFWRWRPACYEHRVTFESRLDHDEHYAREHQ